MIVVVMFCVLTGTEKKKPPTKDFGPSSDGLGTRSRAAAETPFCAGEKTELY